ncbi:hypothetical protein [Streptomyces sp. NBC_01320]|uniref:hypothetical protein n=1 Tax=Streptomyces sp. NBC_01320 TaxID=2903824 RepID=UPI002E13EA8E|nr:hypothetical protein OG395_44600 [Streptomyces sp. NBC_01320]
MLTADQPIVDPAEFDARVVQLPTVHSAAEPVDGHPHRTAGVRALSLRGSSSMSWPTPVRGNTRRSPVLIAAVVLNYPDLRRGIYAMLDVTGIAFFAIISILGMVLDRQDLCWLETCAQVLSNGVIAAVFYGPGWSVATPHGSARSPVPLGQGGVT